MCGHLCPASFPHQNGYKMCPHSRCIAISFLFIAKYHPILRIGHSLSNHSSAGGHTDHLHFLAIMNNIVDIRVQAFM